MWWFGGAAACAAGWVHDPGSGYAEIVYRHGQSRNLFLADGTPVPLTDAQLLGELSPLFSDGRYATNGVGAYVEYGLLPKLELVLGLPFVTASNRWQLTEGDYGDIVQRNSGFGDLTAGARVGTTVGRLAVSASASARAPLYDNSPEVLNQELGNSSFEDDRVPLGPGTIDGGLSGGAGVCFGRGWGLAEAGVRVRDRQYSTTLPTRLELGAKPLQRLAISVGVDAELPVGDRAAPNFLRDRWGRSPLVVDHQAAVSAAVGASLELARGFGLTGGVARTLAGARFPRLTSVSIGISSRFAMPWVDGPKAAG